MLRLLRGPLFLQPHGVRRWGVVGRVRVFVHLQPLTVIYATLLFVAVAPFAAPVGAAVQPNSDLSGRWVLDDPEVAATGPRRPFCLRECEITQTKSTLTVIAGGRSESYTLDGLVKRTEGGFTTTFVIATSARIDKGVLVIVTKVGDQPESTVRVSREGTKLLVESSDAAFLAGTQMKTLYRRVK